MGDNREKAPESLFPRIFTKCPVCGAENPSAVIAAVNEANPTFPEAQKPSVCFDRKMAPLFSPTNLPLAPKGLLCDQDVCVNCGALYVSRMAVVPMPPQAVSQIMAVAAGMPPGGPPRPRGRG